jgi:NAD(P)-dependent dehydrogenase (short-subunit alcohol dehydrogenase family)
MTKQYQELNETKLLRGKIAVIFGAGGAIGSQVAREFSKEGAIVFLSGKHLLSVESVVKEIRTSQGKALSTEAAEVDALNEKAVNDYLDGVIKQVGKIDVVFNAVGPQPIEFDNGLSTMELSYDKFLIPMNTYVASNFVTARAAARHMLSRHNGVILFISTTPSKGVAPYISAIGAAMGALESMMRCFATEWSPLGVRIVSIRSFGMHDTRTIHQTFENMGRTMGLTGERFTEQIKQRTLPVVDDTAKIAA